MIEQPKTPELLKSLAAYGVAPADAPKVLKMLRDISAGISTPPNDLLYLYGTLKLQGRAYNYYLVQFSGRGIPVYQALAKVLKCDVTKVRTLLNKGKVSFDQVHQALESLTAPDGVFYDLYSKIFPNGEED